MELYIHFGIYKTGSSFLQTICANNRDVLRDYGFFFPESVREADMMAGRISPGNGNGLAIGLLQNDVDFVSSLLKKWCSAACKAGYEKILISDEALIHGFAQTEGLNCLMNAVNRNSIKSVHCFGFFRDPVDHCLSTFKHRAKKGTIPDFKKWVQYNYETPERIRDFLKNHGKFQIQWMLAKYQKNGALMAKIFFEDWLKMPTPTIPVMARVNPSLTISEIGLLHSIYVKDSRLVPYLYQRFIEIPSKSKADNIALEHYYKSIARKFLDGYKDVFDALNVHLINGEKLSIGDNHAQEEVISENHYSFSKEQLDAVASGLKDAAFLSARVKDAIRPIKRVLKLRKG